MQEETELSKLIIKKDYHVGRNEKKETMEICEQILTLDPLNYENNLQYIGTLYELKENEKAEKVVKKFLDLYPENEKYWTLAGRYYRKIMEYTQAQQAHLKAIQLNPLCVNSLVQYSMTLNRMLDYEKQEQIIAKILSIDENNSFAYFSLAMICKSDEDAEKHFRKAIEIEPNKKRYNFQFYKFLKEMNRHNEAQEVIQKAIESLHSENMNDYMSFGEQLYEEDALIHAQNMFRKALKIKEKDGYIYYMLANVLQKLGKEQETYQAYTKAIQFEQNEYVYYSNFAMFLEDIGKKQEAEKIYFKSTQKNPKDHRSMSNCAIMFDKMKRYDEAQKLYLRALDVQPRAKYYYNYGLLLKEEKRFEQAEKMFLEGIKINPQESKYHYHLGKVLQEMGRIDDALEQIEESIKLNSKGIYSLNLYGVLLQNVGQNEKANQTMKKLIKIIEKEEKKKAKPNFHIKIYIRRLIDIIEIEGQSGNVDEFLVYFEKAKRSMEKGEEVLQKQGMSVTKIERIKEKIQKFGELDKKLKQLEESCSPAPDGEIMDTQERKELLMNEYFGEVQN